MTAPATMIVTASGEEAAVAEQQAKSAPVVRPGEWVIASCMLLFFAVGYLAAQDWPFRAALFPRMIAALGLLLSLLRLASLALETVRARRRAAARPATPAAAAADVPPPVPQQAAPVVAAAGPSGASLPDLVIVDDEAEEDSSMEYVFASAGGRAWASALMWIVAFFAAFFVLGVFVAMPVFALVYLRVAGKASWLSAGLYAIATGAFIYLLFRQVLYLPLPTGFIPFLQL